MIVIINITCIKLWRCEFWFLIYHVIQRDKCPLFSLMPTRGGDDIIFCMASRDNQLLMSNTVCLF